MPPPPRSTLFPYTTLFRSGRGPDFEQRGELGRRGRAVAGFQRVDRLRVVLDGGRQVARRRCRKLDRKSTRLNSSHPSISYAVFCLKKKTSVRSSWLCRPSS